MTKINDRQSVRLRQGIFLLLAVALWGTWGPSARAGEIPFAPARVNYQLKHTPLSTFLRRFFGDQGLSVVLSKRVKASDHMLNGPMSGTPAKVFRTIADTNQLVTYYSGRTVFVYMADEVTTRYFAIPADKRAAFRRIARSSAPADEDNYSRVADSGVVTATGVPRYVHQLEKIAATLGSHQEPVKTVFKFFPLKYAWPSDRTFDIGNRRIRVRGVASILRQLLYGQGGGGTGLAEVDNTLLSSRQPSLRGHGLAAVGDADRPDDRPLVVLPNDNRGGTGYSGTVRQSPITPPPFVPANPSGQARIVAVPYRNGLIVRDVPERMPMYQQLIKALDVKPGIVELEATIIEVDTDRLRQLGVEFRYATDHSEVMFANDGTKTNFLQALGADSVGPVNQIPGFQVSAIIGNMSQFIARINALEQKKAARVVARPQVLTLDDIPAVLESSKEVYVPVQGAFSEDLFNVFAGTVLRVTPHMFTDDGRSRLRLSIAIQDGDVKFETNSDSGSTQQDIQSTPVVTRTAVTTQAVINAGESLLLGGLVRDTSTTTTQKVPFLGDIPLLGRLFRNNGKDHARLVRLFLITPRLVRLRGGHVAANATGTGIESSGPEQSTAVSAGDWIQEAVQALRQARESVARDVDHALIDQAEDKLRRARKLLASDDPTERETHESQAEDRPAGDITLPPATGADRVGLYTVKARRLAQQAAFDARLAVLRAEAKAARALAVNLETQR